MRALRNLVLLAVAPVAAIASCSLEGKPPDAPPPATAPGSPSLGAPSLGAPRAAAAPAGSYTCTSGFPQQNFPYTISFGPGVPPDIKTFSSQAVADCFAWGEFIALNWPASDAHGFGDPYDFSPVTWQTYMNADSLFQPDGGAPPAWDAGTTMSASCMAQAGIDARTAKHVMLLSATSKLDLGSGMDIHQAAPRSGPNWLGAQNGTNAWYEVRVDFDEYAYVAQNGLYNANTQVAWVDAGKPIFLPMGCSPDAGETCDGGVAALGAIELKAAWMEVPGVTPGDAGADPRWQRYKLAQAVVVDPETERCRLATLALVGLHILHKTTSQPTWVWATFEQVDNVPAAGVAPPDGGYNFNNPACSTQTLSAPSYCTVDGGTSDASVSVQVPCDGGSPPYNLDPGCPGPVPIQVTRQAAIDPTNAAVVNQASESGIRAYQANSVWQYYELVDVVWSTNPYSNPGSVLPTPHPFNSPTAGGTTVANTTLESYAQNTKCLDCHQYAPTARNGGISSDFSFLFENAGPQAPQNAEVRAQTVKLVEKVKRKKKP